MSVLAVNFSFLCLLIIGCISQAPPDGICGPNKVYTRLENNVTIIAMTNITGEPFDTIYWGDSMNNNYFNLSSEDRYEQLQLGQLKITNVTDSDIGEWVFGVANSNGNESCSVNLALATRPGAPSDVMVSDVTSITAILEWNAPVDKGDPPLTHYKVNLTPAPPSDVALTTVDNSTSFTLSGLVPSTFYIVTVAGVSVWYPNGDPSVSTNFTTNPGPPDIKNVSAQSDNGGNIEVKWTLRHTGGVDTDLVTINIFCRRPGDVMTYTMMSSGSGMPRAPGSTDELSETCEGNIDTCLSNDTLMGKLKVGIVYAGEMYRCGVDVSTMAGSDFQNVSGVITSQIGKPSRPIVSAVAQPGGIKLTLQSKYAGVPSSNDSFEFQVVAINLETRQKYNRTYPYPNYVNQTVEQILSLPIGQYNITVNAFNIYGSSEVWKVGPVSVTMSYSPSPTLTPPSPTTSSTSSTSLPFAAIAGGVIGGVIVVVLLVVVVVVITVFIIANNKKKKRILKVTPQPSEKTKSQPI